MTFDPLLPYGEVLGSTCRLVSWNVWGRFADWQTRQRSLERVLAGLGPDVVCLQESWPRPGGAGHPVHCEVIGNAANDGDNNDLDNPASDHYGLCADLRY